MNSDRCISATVVIASLVLPLPTHGQDRPSEVPAACRAPHSSPAIDHVVIAVRDLATAVAYYQDVLGFTIKPGSPHANGIANAHIRFADATALELLTAANPTDALARSYVEDLNHWQGGAYVAVAAGPVDAVAERIEDVGVTPIVTRHRAFDWVSFPKNHPLHALFFINTHHRSVDTPSQLAHANGALGITSAAVEVGHGPLAGSVLEAIGAFRCEMTTGSPMFALDSATLMVRESEASHQNARVPQVTVRVRDLAVVQHKLGRPPAADGSIRIAPNEAFGLLLAFVEAR